ncbi:hypothetical protein LG288_01525 [Idiomarina seosinensis]|uniref:hypothetical protein n=1 Tax=Idiomarina seosinensis TaxID=281739 RepID=UPI00384EAE49
MFPSSQKQQGAALAMAIFIIVILSFVGLAVVKILGDASKATVSDVYGTRAMFAARSGAEIFLTQIMSDPNSIDSAQCAARVAGDSPQQTDTASNFAFNDLTGLSLCEAEVYCDYHEFDDRNHFRIEAIGRCSVGANDYSRVLTLEASDAVL